MAAYTYILRCADGSYYTGWTYDLEKRTAAHNSGSGAKYTRAHRPVELVYYESFDTKNEAMKREAELKKLTHHEKAYLIRGSVPRKQGGIRMKYGIQMYSVRDITKEDLKGALKTVAEQGYELIEFAGFFDNSAEDVKAWLDENGVVCSGTHSGADLLKPEVFDETVKFMKTIGNRNFIIPWADFSTREKADELIALINDVQPKLEKEGITLSYHNHSHEFAPNEAGIVIYDELTEKTDINFEIDTYWAYVAGKDPVALMEAYKDRLTFIHIKDGLQDGKGTPLGLGTAPIDRVYLKAAELGVPMVVESETLTPDGPTEADICIKWLKDFEKQAK